MLAVRPLAPADVDPIVAAFADDPALAARLRLDRAPGRREVRALVRGREPAVAVAWQGTGELCGGVLFSFEPEHRRANLAVWLVRLQRGRGLGTRAVRLGAAWAIGRLGAERVEIVTEPGNAAMLHAAEAAGFRREGLMRGYVRGPEGRADAVLLARLASD